MNALQAAVDALRISDAEYRAILAQLDSSPRPARVNELRAAKRYPYTPQSGLDVMLQGRNTRYVVRGRNVSSSGIAFLHGDLVSPGTACTLELPTPDGGAVPVEGHVVRCRCVSGRIHEIGVQFEQPLEVEHLLQPAGAREDASGRVCPGLEYSPAMILDALRGIEALVAGHADRFELRRRVVGLLALLNNR
ncbi:MAG: PilZ domain-containing protein [Planctomycetota bacterium]